LGFDPTKEEITKLVNDLGKGDANVDKKKIDFQEFLEIMIVKMSEKDRDEDIKKAFKLFADTSRTVKKKKIKKNKKIN
jgi:centrin-1